MTSKPIYLDYNATTPIDSRVAEAMLPFLYGHFGNPSSAHAYGVEARMAVEKARRQVAQMLGCQPDEIIFTSGGSESNNLAIQGVAAACREKGNHIISTAIEHPAVLEVCAYLEMQGFQTTYIPVDAEGRVNPQELVKAITPATIFVSIMHANNEVGSIQPICELVDIAHSHNILFHTDAAQSAGKIPVSVDDLGVDLLSIAGHKLYAPKGVGALFVRTGTPLRKLVHGAQHEHNMRAGTENVLEIVGLGKACELIQQHLGDFSSDMTSMRDLLQAQLLAEFPWAHVNGSQTERLPNTLNISFKGLEANTILAKLTGLAASAGAACHSEQVEVSHVLRAMHVPLEYAMGTIRLSTGRATSQDEIEQAVQQISNVIHTIEQSTETVSMANETGEIKLTQFTHGLGCACKLQPQLLEQVLRDLPKRVDERVLVGTQTADDAAVFSIAPDLALVQTVDFFTPIVDEPYQFGAISAANSLSDIYAMGAQPLFALAVLAFPSKRLPPSVVKEIMCGAAEKAAEAGISIIGGHSVDDNEPKFGLAVTGSIRPERLVTNAGAQAGDVLLLTKPIGTGIITTAFKQGAIKAADTEEAIQCMLLLNRDAALVMQKFGAHACTDVTGFGLLGHLLGMLRASHVQAVIHAERVPLLNQALNLASAGFIPGGSKNNEAYTSPFVTYAPSVLPSMRVLLNDAQTSGGLLISLPAEKAREYIEEIKLKQGMAVAIGKIIKGLTPAIKVV